MWVTKRAQSINIQSVWEVRSTHTKIKTAEAKNKAYYSQSMQAQKLREKKKKGATYWGMKGLKNKCQDRTKIQIKKPHKQHPYRIVSLPEGRYFNNKKRASNARSQKSVCYNDSGSERYMCLSWPEATLSPPLLEVCLIVFGIKVVWRKAGKIDMYCTIYLFMSAEVDDIAAWITTLPFV